MFYSQCFLSRKGPLGAVWVAAYCHKRLKKNQVTQTDIALSVGLSLSFSLSVYIYIASCFKFLLFFLLVSLWVLGKNERVGKTMLEKG